MSKTKKALQKILDPALTANIPFEELCGVLLRCGFSLRQNGSHHIFHRADLAEILNLQPLSTGKAKPYQVRQVRAILLKLGPKPPEHQ